MAGPADNSIERLEEQLEGAEQTLASLRLLDERQAERVAERMDRLASQLLFVSQPPAMTEVHARLGTTPVDPDELRDLAPKMGSPDDEG